jgi:hypothetical protein
MNAVTRAAADARENVLDAIRDARSSNGLGIAMLRFAIAALEEELERGRRR